MGVGHVHSVMRHDLARFCRRSRCFSRSVEMMVYFFIATLFSEGRWGLMGIYTKLAVSFNGEDPSHFMTASSVISQVYLLRFGGRERRFIMMFFSILSA